MTTAPTDAHGPLLTLLDAFADETRETLISMRAASGDQTDGHHLEMLLREYCCLRDERPLEDAIIYELDLEALELDGKERLA